MGKAAILLLAFATLVSCKSECKKYNEVYKKWKGEMTEISKGHDEALSILNSFQLKIDQHKERLKKFTMYVDAETSKGTKNVAKLEQKIVKESNVNIKEHEHFLVFLNNLRALQGTFENKPFELNSLPEENDVKKFSSLKEATAFWINEKDNINEDHNKALSIITNLEDHIHHHQKEIKEFTSKIDAEKKDKKAKSELEKNYTSNKVKHDRFVAFLKNLKQVKEQFEGKKS